MKTIIIIIIMTQPEYEKNINEKIIILLLFL